MTRVTRRREPLAEATACCGAPVCTEALPHPRGSLPEESDTYGISLLGDHDMKGVRGKILSRNMLSHCEYNIHNDNKLHKVLSSEKMRGWVGGWQEPLSKKTKTIQEKTYGDGEPARKWERISAVWRGIC